MVRQEEVRHTVHVPGIQLFTCAWNAIVYMCVEYNCLHVCGMQSFTCACNAIVYMCMECNCLHVHGMQCLQLFISLVPRSSCCPVLIACSILHYGWKD